MKKLLLVLILCMTLCGCQKNNNNVTWDVEECTTLEDLNEKAGTHIIAPGIVGKENEWFGLISKTIAEYKFDLDGYTWSIRASKNVDEDISGVYSESITFEKDTSSTFYTDDVYLSRFFFEDVQYVINLDLLDKDDFGTMNFDEVVGEIKSAITGVEDVGYKVNVYEEGDDVVWAVDYKFEDGTSLKMDVHYCFENDKMTKVVTMMTYDSEEVAKETYDELLESGGQEGIILEGKTISQESPADGYDQTKAEFLETMQALASQN